MQRKLKNAKAEENANAESKPESKPEAKPHANAVAKQKAKRTRSNKGSAFAIVAVCALLIIIAIVTGFRMSVFLGSSQEMKNSVDAGALNVAKSVFELKTKPKASSSGYGYSDVTDSQQTISLANINRVWGKSFLVNANAEAMSQQGYGSAGNSPTDAFQNASTVNNDLYDLLTKKGNLAVYFNKLVSSKPAKLLGHGGSVSSGATDEWDSAALYRGEESNIELNDPQTIPTGINANLHTKNNQTYLQGYNPSEANGKHFCFVTFHANEASHLVSNSTFDQWKNVAVPNSTAMTLPNTFKESGQIAGQLQLAAAASAVANPMRSYELTIPHSFVAITLNSIATIRLDDGHGHVTTYPQMTYYSDTGTVQPFKSVDLEKKRYTFPYTSSKWLATSGLLSGYVSLGNELQPDNLWQAINALPGDHSAAITAILQRVKEFKPGYTQAELQNLLKGQHLINNGEDTVTYYIFPKYSTPDNTNAQVSVGTAGQLPSWLNKSASPEGSSKTIVKETTQRDKPNTAWSTINEGHYEIPMTPKPDWPSYSADVHRTAVSGTLSWQPGTGWNQCLGVLSIKRKTDVIFTGWPSRSSDYMDEIFGPVQ
jgi:hypothetical protein